jgi:hypothetical protein
MNVMVDPRIVATRTARPVVFEHCSDSSAECISAASQGSRVAVIRLTREIDADLAET